MVKPAVSPEKFSTFGDLLKYLRKREELTQREFAIQVGYSDTQISRLEQNQRVPDAATLQALFVPALHLQDEPHWVERLLELAKQARLGVLPAPTTPMITNNLPAALTTFIGREKEQADIRGLLNKHRLLTLTGPGGVGKTRISLQLGGQVLDEYADGVWFAELAPLSSPELLSQTLASVFGIVTQATRSNTEWLINFLRQKTVLLILDNCEHLLDASAHLADTLLKHCPNLKILATSRESLGILGEQVYPMPSLGLPDIQMTLETFREYESVRLFEERALLSQPDFTLTLENIVFVAQICTRLDGIPLAIELAAARVNMFSTAQIAHRLNDRFFLLTGGSRTALPRQQTLRASIDWSWNLLSNPERTLLRRLTVFAGGWTLDAAEQVCADYRDKNISASAAEAVCADNRNEGLSAASAAQTVDREQGGLESQNIAELMTQLVAKSLVTTNRQNGGEPRLNMHETIYQYALEKRYDAGEQETIRNQHLHYFLDLSGLAESALRGPRQREWYNRLTDERDNLRAALEYASQSDLEAGLFLSARLIDYWIDFDLREGYRWSRELIQNPRSETFPLARAKALIAQGYLLWDMQQFNAVRSIAEECLAVFRGCGDQQGEYEALILLGRAAQFGAGMEQSTAFHQQALALARSSGNVLWQAFALYNLGRDQRDPQRGRKQWEEAITLFRQIGDWRFLAQTLGMLGSTLLSNGDLESAETILDEAYEINQKISNLEIEYVLTGKGTLCMLRGEYDQAKSFLQKNIENHEKTGNRMGYLWGRARLGVVALHEGSIAEAYRILVDTIENFHADQNKNGLAFALEKMAILFVVTGKPEVAARLIGWSDANRKEIGEPRPLVEQTELNQKIATIKAKIGDEAYKTAYKAGWGLTYDQAVDYLLGRKEHEA